MRLDALALAALVAWMVVTGGDGRKDVGFFGDPLPDGLAVLALVAVIVAGAVAAQALGAMILKRSAGERGRPGLLMIPFLIGVSALVFFLGDLVVPQ